MSDSSNVATAGASRSPATIGHKQPFNVLIVGVGGQGVIMVSKVLAALAQCARLRGQAERSARHGQARRLGVQPRPLRRAGVVADHRQGRGRRAGGAGMGRGPALAAVSEARRPASSSATPSGSCRRSPASTASPARRCAIRARPPNRSRAMSPKAMRSTPPRWRKNSATSAPPTSCCSARCRPRSTSRSTDWESTVSEFVPKKTIAVNLEAFRLGRTWIEEAREPSPADDRHAKHAAAHLTTPRLEITADWCKSCDICVKLCPERCLHAECRPHRRTGRAGEMHRLPAVRMAVPGFRDPGPSRCADQGRGRRLRDERGRQGAR